MPGTHCDKHVIITHPRAPTHLTSAELTPTHLTSAQLTPTHLTPKCRERFETGPTLLLHRPPSFAIHWRGYLVEAQASWPLNPAPNPDSANERIHCYCKISSVVTPTQLQLVCIFETHWTQ